MKKVAIIILSLVCLFSSNSFGNLIETDGKNVFIKGNGGKFYVIDEKNIFEVSSYFGNIYEEIYYEIYGTPVIKDYYISDGYIFITMAQSAPNPHPVPFICNSYDYGDSLYGFLIIKINLENFSYEAIEHSLYIKDVDDDYIYSKIWVSNGVIYSELRSFDREDGKNALYFYYNSEKKQWIEIDYGSEISLINKQGILFTKDKRILTSDNKEINVFKYYHDDRFSTSPYPESFYKFFDFYLRYSDPDTYSSDAIYFVGSILSKYDYDYGYEFFYPQLVKYQGKFVAIDYDPKENVYYRVGQFGNIFKNEEKLESPFGDEVIFIDVCVTDNGVFFLTNDNRLARFYNGDWHEFNLLSREEGVN